MQPAQAAAGAAPGGFEHPVGLLAQEGFGFYNIIYGAAVGLEGEDGGAVLQGAEGGQAVVGGEEPGGGTGFEELVLECEGPTPGGDCLNV